MPRAQIERLLEFCDLPWDDTCLRHQDTDRAVGTASNWQVRQPLYRHSVQRWRRYEQYLGPLLTALRDAGVALASE